MAADDWIQPGAAAVEHTYSATGGTFTNATIARVTKTLVTLDNGRKYSRKTLRPPGDTAYRRRLMRPTEVSQ